MLYEAIMHAVMLKVWTGCCACVGPGVPTWFELQVSLAVYLTGCLHPTNAHMSQGGRFTAVPVDYSFQRGVKFDRCKDHDDFEVCYVYGGVSRSVGENYGLTTV